MTSHRKHLNLLNSMLFRTLNVMFKIKQLFTKNYLLFWHITLFSVHFNSFAVILSQNLKVSKSYQNHEKNNVNQKAVRSFKQFFALL